MRAAAMRGPSGPPLRNILWNRAQPVSLLNGPSPKHLQIGAVVRAVG